MYESSRLVTRASIARSLSYSNFGDAKKRYDDKLKLKSWEEGSEEGLHVLSSGDQGGVTNSRAVVGYIVRNGAEVVAIKCGTEVFVNNIQKSKYKCNSTI